MIQAPLISIITITFNASAEIAPTVTSLNMQTMRDFEHVVIDGASRDNTVQLVRDLSAGVPRILSEPDRGLYDAMNKGLAMAKGKYVLFLNAGDALHAHDTLELYAAQTGPDADIIYGDTNIVDGRRNFIAKRHLSAPETLTFHSFSKGMLICHQAFMVRRAIAPRFDLSYSLSSDYDWTVRCIRNTKPDRCRNLHAVTIDYLADGLSDRKKVKSLRERFSIMCRHYGTTATIGNHLLFAFRALGRAISH